MKRMGSSGARQVISLVSLFFLDCWGELDGMFESHDARRDARRKNRASSLPDTTGYLRVLASARVPRRRCGPQKERSLQNAQDELLDYFVRREYDGSTMQGPQ